MSMFKKDIIGALLIAVVLALASSMVQAGKGAGGQGGKKAKPASIPAPGTKGREQATGKTGR